MMPCPACGETMSKMCYECGAFFDEPEYIVYDLYDYKALPRRCYKREDHFKEVLAQFQGSEGKHMPPEILDKIRDEIDVLSETTVIETRHILLRNFNVKSIRKKLDPKKCTAFPPHYH